MDIGKYCISALLVLAVLNASASEHANTAGEPAAGTPASDATGSTPTDTSEPSGDGEAPTGGDTVIDSTDTTENPVAQEESPVQDEGGDSPAEVSGDEAEDPAVATAAQDDAETDLDAEDATAAEAIDSDAPGEEEETLEKTAESERPPVEPRAQKQVQPAMDMATVIALLQQQQQELAEQRELLQTQSRQIDRLKQEIDVLRAPAPVESGEVVVARAEKADPVPTQTEDAPTEVATTEQREAKEKKVGEGVARAQADDPTRDLMTQFPGAWRLPGTNAALAIGGYVKTAVVFNNDPLEIRDRFIVGSIPVDDTTDIEAQSSITASQSRLNFDLREPTDFGILRAFIEGDFAQENDTFRLRHAFGQWKKVLAGKTWSAFVDTAATPEEVDFEGLNGRINVRQSQVRFMPTIGQNYEFQLSLEDPNPEIQNGQGVTRAPDLVASGRFQLLDRLHVKLALLGRQIRGQVSQAFGGGVDKKYAWGSTLSGRFQTPRWDERDSLLFQLNAGNGIGRYVNDLSSVGNFDGIFNPKTGELELFDVISGYVSWQHWWRGSIRSNFTFGAVEVDNPGFVEGSAYKQTLRFSTNLLWTPTPRIDIGAEYLWGRRENEDGNNDTATQIQMSARYRF